MSASNDKAKKAVVGFVIIVIIFALATCGKDKEPDEVAQPVTTEQVASEPVVDSERWYVGDTSGLKTIEDWINADDKTKLVYCADVIVTAHKNDFIKINANSIDDYKPYAEDLMKQLNDFSQHVDANIKQQPLKDTTAMIMLMMWKK
ncbi:hypothetical protein [Psychrobacter sp. I-STPA6b]|uniref:hypothetical protein n=1 Tax=Psychrobacter sp. I-STPA6b TaxID=2585718 RepID=UPI001D0CB8AD|nr:hypothetical protein [Psychrobacter sp. I-STPA6b]